MTAREVTETAALRVALIGAKATMGSVAAHLEQLDRPEATGMARALRFEVESAEAALQGPTVGSRRRGRACVVTRFVDDLEAAGLLNDRLQHRAIYGLLAARECDYYTLISREENGSVVVDLCRWMDESPVCRARVGLSGDVLVDVNEVIA